VKKQLNQEHLIGIVCLLIALIVLLITPSFPKGQANINITGPAFFPNLLAYILILCGIYEILIGFFQEQGRLDIKLAHLWAGLRSPQVINVLLIVLSLIFFILFFEHLGFVVCTFLILSVIMFRLGVPFLKNLVYTIGFVVIILVIFGRLFSISLPSGVLEYIGL
jgi:hypothetical protein